MRLHTGRAASVESALGQALRTVGVNAGVLLGCAGKVAHPTSGTLPREWQGSRGPGVGTLARSTERPLDAVAGLPAATVSTTLARELHAALWCSSSWAA